MAILDGRALETRPLSVDPPFATDPRTQVRARSGLMLRRGQSRHVRRKPRVDVSGHRLDWDEIPFRTPGKIDKPLRYASFGG